MKKHFIFIKKEGFSPKGELMSGEESVEALSKWGGWTLFQNTRNRKQVAVGDEVAIYIGGKERKSQNVVATAQISAIREWSQRDKDTYPLMLDDIPSLVVEFKSFKHLKRPCSIFRLLDHLDIIPKNRTKWGAVLVGWVRQLTEHDFKLLTDRKQVGAT